MRTVTLKRTINSLLGSKTLQLDIHRFGASGKVEISETGLNKLKRDGIIKHPDLVEIFTA